MGEGQYLRSTLASVLAGHVLHSEAICLMRPIVAGYMPPSSASLQRKGKAADHTLMIDATLKSPRRKGSLFIWQTTLSFMDVLLVLSRTW